MIFHWKQASYIKAPAQTAGEVCLALEQQGELSAKTLLDASRDEAAPLHGEFEWNDGIAAEKYRETQARHIINCLIIQPEEGKEQTVRAFFNITNATGSDYISTAVIINTPTLHEQLLVQARRDAQVFSDKYRTLSEVKPIIDAIEKVVGEYDTLKKAV